MNTPSQSRGDAHSDVDREPHNEESDRDDDAERAAREHEDDLLDEALMETFPASDPISIARPKRNR